MEALTRRNVRPGDNFDGIGIVVGDGAQTAGDLLVDPDVGVTEHTFATEERFECCGSE
jgi:hypothetical protein